MTESATPDGPRFSPWWSLLLLPAALLIGWGIGQLPGPPPRPPAERPTRVATRRSGARPLPAIVRSEAGASQAPGPAAASFQTSPEPRRLEYSTWTTSYESALAESRRTGKPVLIDFSAEWCGYCRALEEQVLAEHERGRAVELAVVPLVIMDRTREEGSNPPQVEELRQRYQVDAFPTLVVFSPAGGRSEKLRGYAGADATVEWIQRAAEQVR